MDGVIPDVAGPAASASAAAGGDDLDRLLAGFRLPAWAAARLADRFRAEAAAAGAPDSAAERAEAALGAWFAEVLGSPERALSRGRAAFLIAGGPEHFADRLLAAPVPAGLAASLRRACPVPVPAGAPRAMPAQSLGAEAPRPGLAPAAFRSADTRSRG